MSSHDLVDLILMALDNEPPPPIERVSGLAGRRARVENGVNAILARYAVMERPTDRNATSRPIRELASIEPHNGAPVTAENLRYAATHQAVTSSWIFDVLTGIADLIDESEA